MAQKVQVLLVDDLDGGDADETVAFSLGAASYEIDLSDANATRLRKALQPFVDAARKAGPSRRRGGGPRTTTSRARSTNIRIWAKERGIKVNERGRIPASVVEQYDAAH
jgi:Lsr2